MNDAASAAYKAGCKDGHDDGWSPALDGVDGGWGVTGGGGEKKPGKVAQAAAAAAPAPGAAPAPAVAPAVVTPGQEPAGGRPGAVRAEESRAAHPWAKFHDVLESEAASDTWGEITDTIISITRGHAWLYDRYTDQLVDTLLHEALHYARTLCG